MIRISMNSDTKTQFTKRFFIVTNWKIKKKNALVHHRLGQREPQGTDQRSEITASCRHSWSEICGQQHTNKRHVIHHTLTHTQHTRPHVRRLSAAGNSGMFCTAGSLGGTVSRHALIKLRSDGEREENKKTKTRRQFNVSFSSREGSAHHSKLQQLENKKQVQAITARYVVYSMSSLSIVHVMYRWSGSSRERRDSLVTTRPKSSTTPWLSW